MTRLAASLLAGLLAGCGSPSSAPAPSPEALRQQATTSRAAGQTDEAAGLLVAAIQAQPAGTRDQRAGRRPSCLPLPCPIRR